MRDCTAMPVERKQRRRRGGGASRPPCSRQHLLSIASTGRQEGDFSTNHSVLQDYLLRGPADAHHSPRPQVQLMSVMTLCVG